MANITVSVDDDLKKQMDAHPEINWSEVARSAIRTKLNELSLMEQLVTDSQLTDQDVEELATEINRRATERATKDVEECEGVRNQTQ